MKKKGFTLVELLAAIIILGILAIVVLPDIIDIFNSSQRSSLKVQENQLLDAGGLYVQDYCSNPMWGGNECANNYYGDTYYDEDGDIHQVVYVCSGYLKSLGYIDDIYFDKDNLCEGAAVFDYNISDNSFSRLKGYLACGPYGKVYVTGGDYSYVMSSYGTSEVYYSTSYDGLYSDEK